MLLSHSSQATCQKENVLPRCGEGCGIGPGKRGGHNTKPAADHEGRPPARLLRLAFAHGSIGRNTAMRTISAGRRKPRSVPGSAAARPQATTTNNVPLVSSFVLRIAQQGNCRRRRRFPRGRRAEILEPNRACRVASAVPDQSVGAAAAPCAQATFGRCHELWRKSDPSSGSRSAWRALH